MGVPGRDPPARARIFQDLVGPPRRGREHRHARDSSARLETESAPVPGRLAHRSRWLWKTLSALAVCGVVGVLSISTWRWAFERAAASGELYRLLNRRPDRFSISWQAARSRFPGYFEVEGLELGGRTQRRAWQLRLDQAQGWLSPWRLLLREIALDRIQGRGLSLAVRRFADDGPDEWLSRLPQGPPPELEGIELRPPDPLPPGSPAWSVRIERASIRGPTRVALDGHTFAGDLDATVGFQKIERSAVRILPSRIRFEGLTVLAGRTALAQGLAGVIDWQSRAFPYRGARFGDALRASKARIALERGHLETEDLARAILSPWPWVRLDAKRLAVRGRMSWEEATLTAPSRLELEPDLLRLHLLGFEVAGLARVELRAARGREGSATQVAVDFRQWRLGRPEQEAWARGSQLLLLANSDPLTWGVLPTPRGISLELGRAEVPDLAVLNAYLPAAGGFAIKHGSGELSGTITWHLPPQASSGSIQLDAPRLGLEVRGNEILGSLRLTLALSNPDFEPPGFGVDGSRIELTGLQLPGTSSGLDPSWWGELEVVRGRLHLGPPAALEGDLLARAADTSPLVALYELRQDLPKWLERLLTVRHPTSRASVRWQPGRLEVSDSEIALAHGEIRGRLLLANGDRRGKLLVRWGRLRAGAELEGDRSRLLFRNLEAWFGAPLAEVSSTAGSAP